MFDPYAPGHVGVVLSGEEDMTVLLLLLLCSLVRIQEWMRPLPLRYPKHEKIFVLASRERKLPSGIPPNPKNLPRGVPVLVSRVLPCVIEMRENVIGHAPLCPQRSGRRYILRWGIPFAISVCGECCVVAAAKPCKMYPVFTW